MTLRTDAEQAQVETTTIMDLYQDVRGADHGDRCAA